MTYGRRDNVSMGRAESTDHWVERPCRMGRAPAAGGEGAFRHEKGNTNQWQCMRSTRSPGEIGRDATDAADYIIEGTTACERSYNIKREASSWIDSELARGTEY